jgi:hypothetical protein
MILLSTRQRKKDPDCLGRGRLKTEYYKSVKQPLFSFWGMSVNAYLYI